MSLPDVAAMVQAFRADLAQAADPAAVEEVRRVHLGKKSPVKLALGQLKDVDPADRPAVAASIQSAQKEIEAELDAAAARIKSEALNRALASEWQDLTLPGAVSRRGSLHPLEVVERRCLEVLRQLGFEVATGPEVEHPYYNFDALNIPEHHPARDMQDTFWVQGGLLLRSHTTTVQARVLQANREKGASALPIRIASMGRVYRNEAVDATHLAMFHQLEGLWVDRGLTFAHLKGVLDFVARSLFGDRKVRFKPKFYPYTEPSVGVDLACGVCDGAGCEACHGAGWVTILGAGMVHPKVFREFGFDPNEVSGIAFGLGTTRMAAQWSGVTRPKSMYESDLRVHAALSRGGEG